MTRYLLRRFRNRYLLVYYFSLFFTAFFFIVLTSHSALGTDKGAIYVGSPACRQCHPIEYENFVSYAKKSHSFESIERLRKGLSQQEIEQCYSCHTTGYGKNGGFVSLEETPHLKNAGCEVCHGPASEHVLKQDASSIKRELTKEDCVECHISERVTAFRFKPLIHGGAH